MRLYVEEKEAQDSALQYIRFIGYAHAHITMSVNVQKIVT